MSDDTYNNTSNNSQNNIMLTEYDQDINNNENVNNNENKIYKKKSVPKAFRMKLWIETFGDTLNGK
jgi:hypothetical protein